MLPRSDYDIIDHDGFWPSCCPPSPLYCRLHTADCYYRSSPNLLSLSNRTCFTRNEVSIPHSPPAFLHHFPTRISIAHQHIVRTSGSWSQINWRTYLTGYLVMVLLHMSLLLLSSHIDLSSQCWAGGVWSHILLGAYPPPLYSIYPWIGYISINILVAVIFHIIPPVSLTFFSITSFKFHVSTFKLPRILTPHILDTLLFPLDAILRLGSITTALDLVHMHSDPRLSQSLFLRLFASAVASAGGWVTAATLAVWTPEWHFTTPVFLKGGVVDTVDVWGGMLAGAFPVPWLVSSTHLTRKKNAAFVYGLFTASHPTYQSLLLSYSITTQKGPILTPLGARSAATVVLMAIFFWKVVMVHWIPLIRRVTQQKMKTQ